MNTAKTTPSLRLARLARVLIVVSCAALLHAFPAAAAPKFVRHARSVPNQYFVALDAHAPAALEALAHSVAMSYGGRVLETYPAALGGFLLEAAPENAMRLAEDPRVKFVEENSEVELEQPQVSAAATAGDGTYLWWLDRIDQAYPDALDGLYYYCNTGANVIAYVLDEGVDQNHPELLGRVALQHDFMLARTNVVNPCASEPLGWHGTAVASVLGGRYSGVADSVSIVSLRTMGCTGGSDMRALVGALNWIITAPNQAPYFSAMPGNPYVGQPGVINVSGFVLPGSYAIDIYPPPDNSVWTSPTIETVFRGVANAGLVVVTSANNYGWDACKFAPANLAFGQPNNIPGSVITVGGTMLDGGVDKRWFTPNVFGKDKASNSGNCISLWAPAKDVYAARHSGYGRQYDTASGTSFSAPIVAGMAARYMQAFKKTNYRAPNPQEVHDFLDLRSRKYVFGSTTVPLVKETIAPAWNGTDPYSPTTSRAHPAVSTWRIVGNAYWLESCRSRPVRR